MRARALALCALASGCASFTTLSRAHTIGEGRVQAFAAPEALVVPSRGQTFVRPIGEIGLRYGATSWLDLEGRVTTFGGTAAAHVQIVRNRRVFGLEIMAAPAVAYTTPDKLTLDAPIVVGLNLGHDHQLVVAPRLAYQLRFPRGYPRPVSFLFGGASLGVALRVVPRLSLMPEIAAMRQIWAPDGFSSTTQDTFGLQLALGVLVDF